MRGVGTGATHTSTCDCRGGRGRLAQGRPPVSVAKRQAYCPPHRRNHSEGGPLGPLKIDQN